MGLYCRCWSPLCQRLHKLSPRQRRAKIVALQAATLACADMALLVALVFWSWAR